VTALVISLAFAIDRETVFDHAAEYTTHVWTMGSDNQYGSCSSSYVSDYTPGSTYRGIPYDWGGWVTTSDFDAKLDDGYGAGSHSWHGVLSCTVGVDCSGFVSRTWDTSQKYSTSTFQNVSSEISVSSLERGDALNDAGSHIVLYAYESDAGLPIHYEANGALVFVDVDQGWSSFSSYEAIRYDSVTDGATTGTFSSPIEINAFPFEDFRWTAGAASDAIDSYGCSPTTDESGPEQVYRVQVATSGVLTVQVSDGDEVDVDVHVLDGTSGDDCLARDDTTAQVTLEPGEHWIVADTWVGSYEYSGPYVLTASFTGAVGEVSEEDETDVETGDGDEGTDPDGAGEGGDEVDGGDEDDGGLAGLDPSFSGTPGDRVALHKLSGCAAAPGGLWLLGLLALGTRRRS